MKMRFDVKCVRDMLLNSGEVYTVRKWRSLTQFSIAEFECRSYNVERIRAVSGKQSILKYVRNSGFDNVDDWWDTIREFRALRGHLYHVTLQVDPCGSCNTDCSLTGFEDLCPKFMMGMQNSVPGINEALALELMDCDVFRAMALAEGGL